VRQHFNGVIADRADADPVGRELGLALFQLNELGFAVRSPVRRADERHHHPSGAPQALKGLKGTVLVACLKLRDPRPDRKTEFHPATSHRHAL
jgi:hypothetical protein